MDFDLNKLSKYFEMYLVIRHRTADTDIHYLKNYIKCESKHFTDKNFHQTMNMENLFCPDDQFNELYKIKNGYGNMIDRFSFSIEIDQCNSKLKNDCESE